MTLQLHNLPQEKIKRVVGWWGGSHNNERFVGSYIARVGTSANKGRDKFYIQVFGTGKEGYELPLGTAEVGVQQLLTGRLAFHFGMPPMHLNLVLIANIQEDPSKLKSYTRMVENRAR